MGCYEVSYVLNHAWMPYPSVDMVFCDTIFFFRLCQYHYNQAVRNLIGE